MFSALCVLGSSLFALGSHFKGTPYLLPLMLIGRLIFGLGSVSLVGKATLHKSYTYSAVSASSVFDLSLLCVLVSVAGPNHSYLVQRQRVMFGVRSDSRFLSPGFSRKFFRHTGF